MPEKAKAGAADPAFFVTVFDSFSSGHNIAGRRVVHLLPFAGVVRHFLREVWSRRTLEGKS
jgi:hypothetical protein